MKHKRFLLELTVTNRSNVEPLGAEAPMDMDLFTARQAIDRVQQYPLKIKFAGGEPMLNFRLVEQVCQYVQSMNLDAILVMRTNGMLVDKDIAQKMSEYNIFPSVNLEKVPRINQLEKDITSQTVHGIRQLGAQGLTVGLNAAVTDKSIEKLPQLVDFALYMGNVRGIGLDLPYGSKNNIRPQQLRQTFLDMEQRSRELERTFGKRIAFREIDRARRWLDGKDLNSGRKHGIVVAPDGTLFPLDFPKEERFSMGTLQDFQPDDLVLPKLHPDNEELTQVLFDTAVELAKNL